MDDKLHDEIAKLAYELYEESGRIEGRDQENWNKAEEIVRARYAAERNSEVTDFYNKKYIGHEKRRHKRVVVRVIQGGISSSLNTKIINISAEGAAVVTTRRLPINKEYGLKINHKKINHKRYALQVKGRIVWSLLSNIERTGSGDIIAVYKAGIKFQHPLFKVRL